MFSPLSNAGELALFVLGAVFFSILIPVLIKHDLISNVLGLITNEPKNDTCSTKEAVKVGDKAHIYFERGFVGLYGTQNNLGKCSKNIHSLQSGLHTTLLPINQGVDIIQKIYDKDEPELILSIEVQVKEVNLALLWVSELKQTCCDNGILLVIQRHN